MKKNILAATLLTISLLAMPLAAHGESQMVTVQVARFPVFLNGVNFSESYLEWLTENYWSRESKFYSQYP